MRLTESTAPLSRAPSGRIVSLDVIKILSAFMVVFYHYRFFDLGHFENGRYLLSVPQFLLCLCSASVPLFFMVNGALLLALGFFTLLRCFDRIANPRLKRLLASLGSGVLTTYLLHVSIRSVLQATILPPGRQYSALLIAGIALAVCLLCWLIDLLLKRIPLVRELVRL